VYKRQEDVESTLATYANSKLKNKEEGISITDAKTLKKHFSLLSPTDQADVLTYAKNMANTQEQMGKLATALPEDKPQSLKETPVLSAPKKASTAPKTVNLKPNSTSMVKTAPAQPTAPKQPAYVEKAMNMPKTTVQWYEEMYDFGEIKQGDVVTHVFKFKNIGNEDLLITRVKASCGCTTPEWSNEPIAPGEEGMIKVSFNSRGKGGMQMKAVNITYNGDPIRHSLRFKGKVVTQ